MAIENNPRPDNIPLRPRLTAEVLRHLYAADIAATSPSTHCKSADLWLADMRAWAAWAIEYCKRLDAMYVEHHAIAHDRRIESGDLAGYRDDTRGIHYAATDNCKVCAYLLEQYQANQL